MHHLFTAVVLFLMLAPSHVTAHGSRAEDENAGPRHLIDYEEVGLYDSYIGESKKSFMIRVGQGLLYFTDTRRVEGCGVVQVGKHGQWRVRLTTTGSQMACVRVAFKEIGYQSTTEFIHSHPPISRLVVNLIDARIFGREVGSIVGVFPPEFSPVDKKNGGGWLVVPKWRWDTTPKLIYMGPASNGNTHTVAKLTSVPLIPPVTPGVGAYVMSANGSESTRMSVATRWDLNSNFFQLP